MASPSRWYSCSSSSSSSSSPSFLNPIVTLEEFKTFHSIDRTLYTRLVLNLGRDPAESMQVMALWIWLERAGYVDDLVDKMLSLPDTLINTLYEEAVLCLNCIANDQFHFSYDTKDVPLIHSITKTGLSLHFFHENRLGILRGVTKIITDVCAKAFEDVITQQLSMESKARGKASSTTSSIESIRVQDMNKGLSFYGAVINPVLPTGLYYNGVYGQTGSSSPARYRSNGGGQLAGNLRGFDTYDLAVQRQILNSASDIFGEGLRNIQVSSASDQGQEQNKDVPEENRTIFLTFSKGYPISEDNVREFFTRKHGECIEAIYMQEVLAGEQPLYARLIVRTPTIVQVILEGKSKAKFTIDGKHVWARKYVRKNPKSSSPTSSPQPASPAAPSQP